MTPTEIIAAVGTVVLGVLGVALPFYLKLRALGKVQDKVHVLVNQRMTEKLTEIAGHLARIARFTGLPEDAKAAALAAAELSEKLAADVKADALPRTPTITPKQKKAATGDDDISPDAVK